jgi:hypothetical protein
VYNNPTGAFITPLATYNSLSPTWGYIPSADGNPLTPNGITAFYDNGFPCPGVPNVTATVRLMFPCGKRTGQKMSVQQGSGPCDFVFTFDPQEYSDCPPVLSTPNTCGIGSFNMNALNSSSGPYFAKGSDGYLYKMNVCGPVRDGTECQDVGGMLCKYDPVTNAFIDALSLWQGDGMDMSWTNGVVNDVSVVEGYTMNGLQACDATGRPVRVKWQFSCNRFTSVFSVMVSEADGCLVVVSANTPAACAVQ